MNKNKLIIAVSNEGPSPSPEPGTPEFRNWLQQKVQRASDFYFRPDAPELDQEDSRRFLVADFEGLAASDDDRRSEDQTIEAEQRAHARRHLKPV